MAKFNKDSVGGTVTVVVLLSLVCSIVVSGAAVALKAKQDEQKALDVQRNILTVSGLMKEDSASVIKDTYNKFIEPRLVDLQSGDFIQASKEDVEKFDPKTAVKSTALSQAIPAEQIYGYTSTRLYDYTALLYAYMASSAADPARRFRGPYADLQRRPITQ